jgi:hypothetical protein
MDTILEQLHATRQAASKLNQLSNADITTILNRLADACIA